MVVLVALAGNFASLSQDIQITTCFHLFMVYKQHIRPILVRQSNRYLHEQLKGKTMKPKFISFGILLDFKGGVYLVDVLSYIAKYVYFSPSVYQKLYREV